MVSDKRPFTHITVNAEEEDDLVIQAGAVSADETSYGGGVPSGEDAASGGVSAGADHAGVYGDALREHGDDDLDADLDADEDAAASEAARSPQSGASGGEGASVGRAGVDKPHEGTSLQDLESAKMGGLQKAIVAVAVLAVVAFVVYYIFFR